MISGMDASNLNGLLDWPAMRRQYGLSFAIVKATEGTGYPDPDFPASWAALKELGIARGAYHFAHPSNGPVAEAEFFLGYVRAHGLDDADFLTLDLEDSDGLPPHAVAAYGRQFCAHLSTSARRPVPVYTFISFAEAGNCAGLGGYPLWIADWSSAAGSPRIPAPWKTWALHQYSSQGIDLDVANYPDAAAMTQALGVQKPPKPFPPPQLPPLEDDMQLKTGKGASDAWSFEGAPYSNIGFISDPGGDGIAGTTIRVALHYQGKGPEWLVKMVTLTPAQPKQVLSFAAKTFDGVRFTRMDDGGAVGVNFA